MARACGSYPQCRWFKSNYRYHRAPNRGRISGPMVKRLRHRPFTAVTRVRVPFGSPAKPAIRVLRIAVLFSLLLFSVHIFLPVFLQPAATCEKIRQGHMRKSNILIKITKPRVYLRLTNRRPQNAAAVIFLLDNSSMFGYNVLARSRNDAA